MPSAASRSAEAAKAVIRKSENRRRAIDADIMSSTVRTLNTGSSASTSRTARSRFARAVWTSSLVRRRTARFVVGRCSIEKYTYGSLRTEYRLLKPIPVIGLSVLAGLRYERANIKNPTTEPSLRGNIDSYGFYLGATSAFGPLYVGWSGTSTGDRAGRIYFFIGTP